LAFSLICQVNFRPETHCWRRGFDPDGLEDLRLSVGLTGNRLVASPVEYIDPGDFNGDGAIDASDLLIWRSKFGPQGDSDADFDGDADGGDFLAWQRGLSIGPPTAGAGTSVPEPSAHTMIVLVVLRALISPRTPPNSVNSRTGPYGGAAVGSRFEHALSPASTRFARINTLPNLSAIRRIDSSVDKT
jgi:hypothetical protein